MINKKRSKKVALVLVCLLIPLGAFGFGYFFKEQHGTKKVTHTLTVDGSINGVASENSEDVECDKDGIVPGDKVEVPISIETNSTADSLLRVKVEPYWINSEDGDTNLSNKNLQIIDENVTSEITQGKWYKEGGYYYYIGNVKTNKGIELVKGVKFRVIDESDSNYNVNDYQDKKIGVKVSMEMVQSRGKAYKVRWNKESLSDGLNNALNEICEDSK